MDELKNDITSGKNALAAPEGGALISLFFRAAHKIRSASGGGDAQFRMLRILTREGDVSQRRLQEIMGITAAGVSELTGKLEDKGWIVRARDEKDRRRMKIKITPTGADALAKMKARDDETVFAALTEQEKEGLRSILTKLI